MIPDKNLPKAEEKDDENKEGEEDKEESRVCPLDSQAVEDLCFQV